jgi:predicted RNase H-like nuclease (RuvC/YqgF family)
MNIPVREKKGGAALAALAVAWFGLAGPVHAEAKKGQDAAVLQTLRKAQGMLRQLGQEKADLEAQNLKLQEQVKVLEAKVRDLAALENEVRQQKAGLEDMRGRNSALERRLGEDADRLRSLAEKQRGTAAELRRYQRDNGLLVKAVAERTRWIEECTGKNADLLAANRELLGKYRGKGVWDTLKRAEPFTGLAGVKEENEVQEFRFKLEDLEVTPWQESKAEGEVPAPPEADEDD